MVSVNQLFNQNKSRRDGFTLVEILIVILIVAILVIIALILINPTKARRKLYDSQRKRDIQAFSSLVTDYELNHSYYPKGEDICYDTPVRSGDICTCHFCGLSKDTKVFGPILNKLYCDPEHPKVDYVYQYDCSTDEPTWYKVYTRLRFDSPAGPWCNYGKTSSMSYPLEPYPNVCSTEPESGTTPIPTIPDGGGPGATNTPAPTSPPAATNTPIPTLPPCPPDPDPKYCIRAGCNNCGTLAECLDPDHPERCDQPVINLYFPGCTQPCQP